LDKRDPPITWRIICGLSPALVPSTSASE